jgi:hypothetical protein
MAPDVSIKDIAAKVHIFGYTMGYPRTSIATATGAGNAAYIRYIPTIQAGPYNLPYHFTFSPLVFFTLLLPANIWVKGYPEMPLRDSGIQKDASELPRVA